MKDREAKEHSASSGILMAHDLNQQLHAVAISIYEQSHAFSASSFYCFLHVMQKYLYLLVFYDT